MSDNEHQLDDSDFGLPGIEKSLGFEKMSVSSPVDTPEPDHMSESELAHAKRPVEADWGELTEREYRDVNTGKEIPANQTVPADQAASDLARARESERQAREVQHNLELDAALAAHEAGREPQQPQQDQQQPELEQPQPEQLDPDAARAEVNEAWAKADEQITEFLKDPHIRERIQAEYDGVKNAAAAVAKQEVERAYNLSAAVHEHYGKAVNGLMAEASGIIAVLYPELQGLSGPQLQGALQVMAQQNPQRVQQLQQLASRAQGLVQAQQRQQYEAQQGQALQQQRNLEQFAVAEEKKYEEATKYESPEAMKAVRSQVYDVVEKSYGIPKQAMNALYSGEQRVDSAAFVRSAAFQLMLTDAVKYRLAQRGVTNARSNPVPKVQRPGVAADGPRVHEGDLAAASARFNLPGGNEGTQGIRNAAAWLTARRGRG